jgi:hypothetical protein
VAFRLLISIGVALTLGACAKPRPYFCTADVGSYSDQDGSYLFEPSEKYSGYYSFKSQRGAKMEPRDDKSIGGQGAYFVIGGILAIPLDIEKRKSWIAFSVKCSSAPQSDDVRSYAINCVHVRAPDRAPDTIRYTPSVGITELFGARLSSQHGLGRRC